MFTSLGIDQSSGNLEGKEVRFGIVNSALWATVTTAASNGSVNSMLDSFTPIGGLVPMWMMQMGEVIFGGVGSGMYGMLAFIFIAVFVSGLMVGRTPEYLGKKIEIFEMKMAVLIVLIPVLTVLLGTAIALIVPAGRAGIFNSGPQGFSEVLYAFSSAGNNNGSAFAGFNANSPFYNSILGIAMLIARYALIIPVLAMAGSLARQEESAGEFRDITHPYPTLYSLVDRCDRHRWSTQFPAGAGAWTHRAAVDAWFWEVVMNDDERSSIGFPALENIPQGNVGCISQA